VDPGTAEKAPPPTPSTSMKKKAGRPKKTREPVSVRAQSAVEAPALKANLPPSNGNGAPADPGRLNWIAHFIWGIADDVLRDLYVRGKYRDVILPMTVLRRFDAALEPTKQDVLKMKAQLDKAAAEVDYLVSAADIEAFEAEHGRIPEGAIVLLNTGRAGLYPDREAYMGTAERGEAAVPKLHFPGLGLDGAKLLVERVIGAVGIDTLLLHPAGATAADQLDTLDRALELIRQECG